MMPPVDPVEPPEGDVAPYPDAVLELGGGRWLSTTGRVIRVPFGVREDLQQNTTAFWEAAALRGTGKSLSELIE